MCPLLNVELIDVTNLKNQSISKFGNNFLQLKKLNDWETSAMANHLKKIPHLLATTDPLCRRMYVHLFFRYFRVVVFDCARI